MSALTDVLAWVVIAAFGASAILDSQDVGYRRQVATLAWVLFAVFWALLVPHFAFTQRSIVEGVLSAIAVPASLYVAVLIWTEQRAFGTITEAVAIMGIIYLPFEMIAFLRGGAIETVARHVEFFLAQLGSHPEVTTGPEGLRSTFLFVGDGGHRFSTRVVLACTGIGSSAVVAGLVMALDAPLRRKLAGVAIAIPIIYGLNVLRVAFIALAHGNQWFVGLEQPVFFLFGTSDPNMVSYLIADRVLAQSASVVALVVITLALLRVVPELSTVVEDVLYLVTGDEYDLSEGFESV